MQYVCTALHCNVLANLTVGVHAVGAGNKQRVYCDSVISDMCVPSMLSKTNSENSQLKTRAPITGKGYLFLKTWDGTGESSVRKLLYALLDLKMGAALKVLKEDEMLSGALLCMVARLFVACIFLCGVNMITP